MRRTLLAIVFAMLVTFGFGIKTMAKDVLPTRPYPSQVLTIGMYQVSDDVVIYKEPDETSQILYRVRWNAEEFFPEDIGFDNFFAIFLPKKSMALVSVIDYDDDWIEIMYNNSTGASGWIKKDDPYKLMSWNNFYNTYGKKYGLTILKGSPESCKNIKASPEDDAKTISTINHPIKINLNVLRGNWALVSVMDLDKTPKTGYVRWRSDDGLRYYFPMLKQEL